MEVYLVGAGLASPLSSVLSSLNKPAASLMRLNSIQKAWTSMKRSCKMKRTDNECNHHVITSYLTFTFPRVTLPRTHRTKFQFNCFFADPSKGVIFKPLISSQNICIKELAYYKWSEDWLVPSRLSWERREERGVMGRSFALLSFLKRGDWGRVRSEEVTFMPWLAHRKDKNLYFTIQKLP